MEPMTLGSPGSPPFSNVLSPFLPGFLMGEPASHSPGGPGSSNKTPKQVHFASSLTTTSNVTSNTTPTSERRTRSHSTPGERSGGPPTVGLFDTLETTKMVSPSPGSLSTSLHTPCEENQSYTWVTVFGFPPSAATTILGHFSQLGHLLEHVYPGHGNWVNLHYSSKMEARRALSYNGRVFGGDIMIGVIPCKDQSVLKDLTNTGTPLSAPKSPRSFSRRLTSPTSPYITSPPSRPRSFIGPNIGDNEVLGAQNVPAKNTSMVSKTIDYFFGW